ncbi:MAG: NitT/TauT family transport system permease protein [Frankiaceae bacterium]|jgi:NitT/TauT family transport system permease protein|nr:NitT/TauT family transport system permease protein [Frankiaceae bacterium]
MTGRTARGPVDGAPATQTQPAAGVIDTGRPGRRGGRAWLLGSSRSANGLRLVVALAALAGLWEVLARYVVKDQLILVPFSAVMRAMVHEATAGPLWHNCATTLLELAIAFPLSVLLGILVGAVLASSRVLAQTFDPILTAIYSLPIVALAPLFVAALGFGLSSKIAMIMLISIFPIIANTESGLRAADAGLIETARSFSASRLQILRTVTLPFSVPFIVGGTRIAFARAIVGAIIAEFFGSLSGIGYAIVSASQNFQTALLLAYVLVLGIVGFLSSLGLGWLERKLAPWRQAVNDGD